MGSEYFINSQTLEDQVRKLLPSQGGAGAGFDLSASTQIIPIIDLTESAEGANVRQDLQTSLSFNDITSFDSRAAETVQLMNTTGYWFLSTTWCGLNTDIVTLNINDGSTDKLFWQGEASGTAASGHLNQSFNIFLPAGHSVNFVNNSAAGNFAGYYKQIADINGVLTSPS